MKLNRYRRMSTDEQDASPARQAEAIDEYCRLHNHEIVADYIDEGISGTANDTRPALMKMIERGAVNGAVGVIVDQQSRLSRTDAIATSAEVLQPLRMTGLRYIVDVAKNQVYDLFDTNCSLFMHIEQGYNAHAESKAIAHRVLTGTQSVRKQGYYLGPRPPFGYKIVDRRVNQFGQEGMGKLAIVEEEAEIIRRIYDLYEQLHSARRVAAVIGWPIYQVEQRLNQPIYAGRRRTKPKYSRGKFERSETNTSGTLLVDPGNKQTEYIAKKDREYEEEIYPQIVSPQQWDAVQAIMEGNCKAKTRRSYRGYLFSGKIYCAHCGQKMSGQCDRNRNDPRAEVYYLCTSYTRGRKEGEACTSSKRVKEKLVVAALEEMMEPVYAKLASPETYREQLETGYGSAIADIRLHKNARERELLEKEAEIATARRSMLRLGEASDEIYKAALQDIQDLMAERDLAARAIERMATEEEIRREWDRQIDKRLKQLASRETMALIERIDLHFEPRACANGKKRPFKETATRGVVTFVRLDNLPGVGVFSIVPTDTQRKEYSSCSSSCTATRRRNRSSRFSPPSAV
jgi:site-specific DNA recombinase